MKHLKTETENKETLYTKEQILGSKKYADRKDIVNALLDDGKEYSVSEVDKLVNSFLKGKVK